MQWVDKEKVNETRTTKINQVILSIAYCVNTLCQKYIRMDIV